MSRYHNRNSNSPSKAERKFLAQQHVTEMDERYRKENMDSVATTLTYRDGTMLTNKCAVPQWDETTVSVTAQDSVSAVLDAQSPKAMLDFASFHNPGGGYTNGVWFAQEEMICAESNLYNILREFQGSVYARRNKTDNTQGLYTSECLYIPDVMFYREDEEAPCDVIVAAAPNAKRARENHVDENDIEQALRERINTVMNIAVDNGIEELVLGAFGCGVFANDAESVASMFKEWIDDNPGFIRHVVFAIPNAKSDNYKAFEAVFSEE